ncbi:hypothetical protein BCR39DRAFT_548938 [Naematelia encephala]|uniref:Uncharacterized protein n=1 Tax=Naematelia encephala TaxID=71784 RepID=A0A1Y2ANT2_9TREE|nr:hypothetical protein BCR39DRAFT_548938 [Naematelia encephala]
MPITDGLAPPMTPAERQVVKSFGGWTAFLRTYGLKPEREEDKAEGKAIVEQMAKQDARARKQ